MTRKLSLAHLTVIAASPPELVRIAAEAGYDCVGLRLLQVTPGDAWPIIEDRALLNETKGRLAEHGLEVLDVELVRLTPESKVGDFKPMLEVAAELGAPHVLTQGHDPEWGRLVDNFGSFCDLAQSFGMTADVEFLTWTDLSTVAHAWALVEQAGRANGGVMIDTLHFSRSRCELADLDRVPPERFRVVQISDAAGAIPTTVEGLIFIARENRLAPGEGDLDLSGMLSRLPPGIPVSVEIPNSALDRTMTPTARARAALESTRKLLTRVDLQKTTSEQPHSSQSR